MWGISSDIYSRVDHYCSSTRMTLALNNPQSKPFTYFSSNISLTKIDVNKNVGRALSAIDSLSTTSKSDYY